MPQFRLQQQPKLEEVVGKFLVCSQHGEPRSYDRATEKWHVFKITELDDGWWASVRPDIYDDRYISWGRSTWLIEPDGSLKFSGADYDTSD